jgi:hypothetical protein
VYPTTEVRWFLAENIPRRAEQWFRDVGEPNHLLESRVDRYLRLPNDNALGIKLRENRLEIKARSATYGNVIISSSVAGRLEGWLKWSFQLADDDAQAITFGGTDPSWVSVNKERMLKRFLVRDQGAAIPVPVDDSGPKTCALELTATAALGQTWWSLAFEASGDDVQSRDRLVFTARQIFATPHPFTFVAGESLSFPQSLRKILSLDAAKHTNGTD